MNIEIKAMYIFSSDDGTMKQNPEFVDEEDRNPAILPQNTIYVHYF